MAFATRRVSRSKMPVHVIEGISEEEDDDDTDCGPGVSSPTTPDLDMDELVFNGQEELKRHAEITEKARLHHEKVLGVEHVEEKIKKHNTLVCHGKNWDTHVKEAHEKNPHKNRKKMSGHVDNFFLPRKNPPPRLSSSLERRKDFNATFESDMIKAKKASIEQHSRERAKAIALPPTVGSRSRLSAPQSMSPALVI